jgi:hypothetical protein
LDSQSSIASPNPAPTRHVGVVVYAAASGWVKVPAQFSSGDLYIELFVVNSTMKWRGYSIFRDI